MTKWNFYIIKHKQVYKEGTAAYIATLGNFIQSANYASTTLNIKDTVASRIFGVYEKRDDTWIK